MSDAWIAFASDGAPDHMEIPHWPAYSLQDRATMIFDRDAACVQNDRPAENVPHGRMLARRWACRPDLPVAMLALAHERNGDWCTGARIFS